MGRYNKLAFAPARISLVGMGAAEKGDGVPGAGVVGKFTFQCYVFMECFIFPVSFPCSVWMRS